MSILRRALSPSDPKASFYRGDGTGRDGYILGNSGGLYKNVLPPGLEVKFLAGYPKSPSHVSTKPRLDAKTHFYHSDGSGRDNYIITNSGGFSRSNGNPKEAFWNELRQYHKSRSPTNGMGSIDYFTWAQCQKPNREARLERSKDKTVKDLVNRLTLPSPKQTKNLSQSALQYSNLKTEVETDAKFSLGSNRPQRSPVVGAFAHK